MKTALIIFVVLFTLTTINLLILKSDETMIKRHKVFAALTGWLFIMTILSLMVVAISAIVNYL